MGTHEGHGVEHGICQYDVDGARPFGLSRVIEERFQGSSPGGDSTNEKGFDPAGQPRRVGEVGGEGGPPGGRRRFLIPAQVAQRQDAMGDGVEALIVEASAEVGGRGEGETMSTVLQASQRWQHRVDVAQLRNGDDEDVHGARGTDP